MRVIRFVITILILALICYCVYYLLELNKEYKIEHTQSGVTTNEESRTSNEKVEENGKDDEENVTIIIPNEEKRELSEAEINKLVTEADKIYDSNMSANVTKSFNEEVGTEIYGGLEDDSGDNRIQALVQHAGSMVSIMPFDNQSGEAISEQYHYGDNNNLVMYVTRRGEKEICRYYFSYGKLVRSKDVSGDMITVSDAEAEVILNRALNIYNRYIK